MDDLAIESGKWLMRRRAAAVIEILKGGTTSFDLARIHGLPLSEVERWVRDFVSHGTEALRVNPRSIEAKHRSERIELLARIEDLTNQIEAYKFARDYLEPGQPFSASDL